MNTRSTRHTRAALAAVPVMLTLLWCQPTTSWAVEFAEPVSYPVGTLTLTAGEVPADFIAVHDFNGDGFPDIAVPNSGSGDISVLLGNGGGTYKAAVNFDAGMASPTSIEVSDFNNDGIQDLAVWGVQDPVHATLSILLGKGDGTFQAPKATPLPAAVDQTTLDLVVADFNLDHRPDLAVLVRDANVGTSRILVLAGSGDGNFQAPQQSSDVLSTAIYNGEARKYLATADFNNDSKPDLAVEVSGAVQVLMAQGDGTFRTGPIVSVADGYVPYHLQVADLNGDGAADLLAYSIATGSRRTSLFLGRGDGSFQAEQILQIGHFTCDQIKHICLGSTFGAPAVGDFNGDGKLDLEYKIYDYPFRVFAGVHLGRGNGAFSPPVPFWKLDPLGVPFVAKDLNGDGLSDFLFLDTGNNAVVIEMNAGPTRGADLGIVASQANGTSYSAVVLNEGPEDATGVTFTDTLPNGVSFASATPSQGTCTHSNGVVTCTIGSLASTLDATVTIGVTVTQAPAEGTYTNSMKVTSRAEDLVLANNAATQDLAMYALTVEPAGTGSGTVTSNPDGINCSPVCSQQYLSGSLIPLVATASTGSVFSGWSGACNSPDPKGCVMTMDSNVSVTATFTKATGSGDSKGFGGGGGGGGFTLVDLCGLLSLGLWRAFRGAKYARLVSYSGAAPPTITLDLRG